MLEYHLKKLVIYLMEKEYATAESISKTFNISEKTVRNRIKELKEVLQKNGGAELIARPRYGYKLKILQEELLKALLNSEDWTEEKRVPATVEERNNFLLIYLLQRRDFVKMEDLADFLYVSKNTLSQSLKVMESIFKRYGISLLRKPSYGIKVEGKEVDIRHLLMDYFIKRKYVSINQRKRQTEIKELSALLWQLLIKYELHLSEIAYENLIDYIYISIKRMEKGFFAEMEFGSSFEAGIKEKMFVRELMKELKRRCQLEIPENEAKYLLVYVAGRRVTENLGSIHSNFVIKEQTDNLAMQMIEQLQKWYKLQFINVFDIRMALNQHLVPFDIRMRYLIPIKNPMLEEIKKEYSLAYEMAHRAVSLVLCPYYQKSISEEEIGFFALIFALAIEKEREQAVGTIHSNILIVCASGSSSSRLLEYKYKNLFKEYIKNIYTCDLLGLSQFDFSKVDYVFTTVPLPEKILVPIFEVGIFLTEEEIKMVGGVLKKKGQSRIEEYYREYRFWAGLEVKDKLEAITAICERIAEQEKVADNFCDLVLEREAYAQMDYGNGIAIPHPNQIASEETFAYVAVLKDAILWNRQKVQVILLTSVGSQPDPNRQFFYETTARFALSPTKIKALIENPVFSQLVSLLEE